MRCASIIWLALFSIFAQSAFAADGQIEGTITRTDGSPLGGVVVVVSETSTATITDHHGRYNITGVPPGTYSLLFSAGNNALTEPGVVVQSAATTRVDKQLDWTITFAETITVTSASRRAERIVEAPAAVTTVRAEVIEQETASGQLPKVIENAPGVDFTQSGLYDFNFSSRGFNSSLNRRILTLIDGRDPAIAFLGAQEWAAISYPIDEMENVEMVRGPGSALYGANAFNGVLNMVTKQPRYSEGGKVQLSGGELNAQRIDARHAGALGGEWYFRILGGWQESDDFAVSRNVTTEYAGLPRERVPLPVDGVETAYAGLRLDKYFGGGNLLTLEGGWASVEGPVFQTGIGRVQVTDSDRPWARFNFNTPHWNVSGFYDSRDANNQVALSSGASLYEDSYNLQGDVQGNMEFGGGKGRLVGGVSYRVQDVDTANPQGVQTLMAEAKNEHSEGLYAQADYNVTSNLKFVVAARYDDGSLFDSQVSPKGSLVWEFVPNHSMRLTYNEAFQVPNYSEFFLRAPAGAPVTALAALEAALKPLLGGVPLGFGVIPVLALGNPNLDVETITGYEAGYSGILGGKFFVTVDYYKNEVQDFVTDLLPGVNPDYPPYAPPSALPAPVQAIILNQLRALLPPANFAAMTNQENGQPAFVVSYTNAGKVDTQGIEVAFNYYMTNNWLADFNYSWFDFEVKEQALGDVLLPNAPEHKFNAGLSYRTERWDAGVAYRWVDDFPWAVNIFKGPVPSYDVVSVNANVSLTDRIVIGANISNALDNEHWEAFGGDILERRALGFVSYSW